MAVFVLGENNYGSTWKRCFKVVFRFGWEVF